LELEITRSGPLVVASGMDALAPAALALTVTFDAVATLGLVLMSYDGPFMRAMLPMTPDPRINLASQLADLLAASVIRGGCALLPMLGYSAALSPFGLSLYAFISAGMTAWMATKSYLAYQLSEGHLLFIESTGVTIHVPMVIAAEGLGIFMSWFVFTLVWLNRHVMKQPAAADPTTLALAYTNGQLQHQRAAVANWLASSDLEAPADEDADSLMEPLIQQDQHDAVAVEAAAAAAAADAIRGKLSVCRDGDADETASFVTAMSRTVTNASSVTLEPCGQSP
jgi:hypothetical protein